MSPTAKRSPEASSSSRIPDAAAGLSNNTSRQERGRSESRRRVSVKGEEKDDADGSVRIKSPDTRGGPSEYGGSMRTLSPRSDNARHASAASRKVRTVPPMAIYEPPTPPSPDHTPLPLSPPLATSEQPKRRRKWVRYSDSSSSGADSDELSSDEEPPWWTFTQQGMLKLRQKNLHRNGRDIEQGILTEGESGKEGGKEKITPKEKNKSSGGVFSSSRRSSRDKDGMGGVPPSSSSKSGKHRNDSPTRQNSNNSAHRLLQPAPIRFTGTQNFFRRSSKMDAGASPEDSVPSLTVSVPPRPSSAPTSPTIEAPSPGLTTLVDGVSTRLPSDEGPVPALDMPISPRRAARRQLTAPTFPRFFKRENNTDDEAPQEILTDSEIVPSASNRRKPRPKSTLSNPVVVVDDSGDGTGTGTPTDMDNGDETPNGGTSPPDRPKTRRKASHMLRLNLPPPMTRHFTNGWPHAGSWQDALYGYYDENDAGGMRPSRSRKATRMNADGLAGVPSPTAEEDGSAPNEPEPFTPKRASFGEEVTGNGATPERNDSDEKKKVNADGGLKKTKTKRQKRFRQALAPPTPSGLGFTPSTRTGGADEYPWNEGTDREAGFDWANGAARKELGVSQNGAADLTRSETRVTGTDTEKTDSVRAGQGKKKGWWPLGGRKRGPDGKKTKLKNVDSDWRRRYKRMLFLDARVTIWIRAMNLAVVVAALGLAIVIRIDLIKLRLPGLIGSSTTLIMAYSCLTILHVLTAIYREYFGKPIGLWGLRSKMLWVCLDLLFVALWSSAMSLAINDLIATPLECTAGGAWWRDGLAREYADLLNDLTKLSVHNNITTSSIASVSSISQTLGITLPASVINSPLTHQVCRRQAGCIALSLLALMLYGGNMVLSLFRIFETVRRTANVSRAVVV
ncbi:hypothetical protein CI109_102562 [Kwoniella shandongensis]|uniref:Uncharacterized protein n=1 Tax=Kwoniella shandongensis TaxID=1734106 RepID=A0A5M6BUS9_9TREE|nr:uncharacterized protein CI109_005822 [Kwoniella shandongensis]KAA5525800.1 hypothetical protein CI109_005822 [Kwoniella shandongensis]